MALHGGSSGTGGAAYTNPAHPGYISGNWYAPAYGTIVSGAAIAIAGAIRMRPFTLYKSVTIQALAAKVTTLSAAGNFQLGIYANNNATGKPTGNVLVNTASLSTGAVATVSGSVTQATLSPGTYWYCVSQDNTVAAYSTISTAGNFDATVLIGSATLATVTGSGQSWSFAGTFGTWPDMTSQTLAERTDQQNALVFFQAI